jgi:hypothetical protein
MPGRTRSDVDRAKPARRPRFPVSAPTEACVPVSIDPVCESYRPTTRCRQVCTQMGKFSTLSHAPRRAIRSLATTSTSTRRTPRRSPTSAADPKGDRLGQSGFRDQRFKPHVAASDIGYGNAVSQQTDGRHLVIDTSRHGGVAATRQCQPRGRKDRFRSDVRHGQHRSRRRLRASHQWFALRTSDSAYDGHHVPAGGSPARQEPSD